MLIPFQNLRQQNRRIRRSAISKIKNIQKKNQYVLGDNLKTFENKFAGYNDVEYCIGVGNGTDSLELILRALDLPKYSEVLIPANTFIATAIAVIRAGLRPILVDIDSKNLLSEADNFKQKITPNSRVFIVVSLYGNYPDMKEIKQLADSRGIFIVEDAAQSQGSEFSGKKMGFYSIAASTSFYPGKNLGAWGDGGAVLTNNSDIANKIYKIRNYGSQIKYQHDIFGVNSRLDEIQAAVLLEKLKYLDEFNHLRSKLALVYEKNLSRINQITLIENNGDSKSNYHLFVIRIDDRSQLQKYLKNHKIETLIHYPNPLYEHKALKKYFSDISIDEYGNTERNKYRILSLPLYPGMPIRYVNKVVSVVQRYYAMK